VLVAANPDGLLHELVVRQTFDPNSFPQQCQDECSSLLSSLSAQVRSSLSLSHHFFSSSLSRSIFFWFCSPAVLISNVFAAMILPRKHDNAHNVMPASSVKTLLNPFTKVSLVIHLFILYLIKMI
jgi:hypothetical protein